MPDRILRDCTDSVPINSLSWQAEVLFYRLIMKADDFGRFTANPRLLGALAFPLRDVRETDLSRWLTECVTAGLVVTYEAEGKKCLLLKKFGQRLRTKRAKYPAPQDVTTTSGVTDVVLPTSCGQTADKLLTDCGQTADNLSAEEKRREVKRSEEIPKAEEAEGKDWGEPFVCDDGSLWCPSQSQVAKWGEVYGTWVEQSLRRANVWIAANPSRRKTRKGMSRFCVNWLNTDSKQHGKPVEDWESPPGALEADEESDE
jgi:hypothetical protein